MLTRMSWPKSQAEPSPPVQGAVVTIGYLVDQAARAIGVGAPGNDRRAARP